MCTTHCWLDFVKTSSFNFWSSWRLRVFYEDLAESQLKSSKCASGCGHPIYDWDTHLFCYPCRDKGKGQDVCVTSKEEGCFNCLQFTSDQKRKLKSKSKKKVKEVEDTLLGQESDNVPLQLRVHSMSLSRYSQTYITRLY